MDEVPEDPLFPFEFTKRAVEKLGRQLEEFCDKEFASIIETSMYLCCRGNIVSNHSGFYKNIFFLVLFIIVDSGEQRESAGEEDDTLQGREASISQSQGVCL